MQKVSLAFHCKPGLGETLLAALAVALVDTRAFDGCRHLETFVSQDNPDLIVILEDWESRTHYEKYLTWRVETGLMEMLEPVLAEPLELRFLDPTAV